MSKIVLLMLLMISTILAGGFGSASQDQDIRIDNPFTGKDSRFIIGTAGETGSYYKAGVKMSKLLSESYAATTDGSGQNLDLLEKGLINVAFVQGDIFNEWKSRYPAAAEKMSVIVTDRTEYVHLIMRKGMDEDDLQKKGSKVLVGLAKSGGAGSWANMKLLEENYIAEPIFGDLDSIAINDLKQKKIDGIIRTSHVKAGDVFISKILKEKDLYVADLDDGDLNDKITLNGETKPIYNFVTVDLENKMFSEKAKMLETKVYIVINNEKTSRKQRAEIADIINIYRATLFE